MTINKSKFKLTGFDGQKTAKKQAKNARKKSKAKNALQSEKCTAKKASEKCTAFELICRSRSKMWLTAS